MVRKHLWTLAALAVATAGGVSLAVGAPPSVPSAPVAALVAASAAEPDEAERAKTAVRDRLAGSQLSELRSYRLDGRNEIAVCGTALSPNGAPAADVVARVVFDSLQVTQSRRTQPLIVLEDAPGLHRGGASGAARQRYCRDAEPVAAPLIAAPPVAQVQPAAVVPADSTQRRVTVASAVNVRSGPGGGAAIVKVAPRGASFSVLSQAPGGWVQLGEGGESIGWAHQSLLQMAPI